jgi:hypothetical protein
VLKSKLRRLAAFGALVLAIVTLTLAAGANAATGKPVTGVKAAAGKTGKTGKTGKAGKTGKLVRPVGDDEGDRGDDADELHAGGPPEEPPISRHFGW